MSRESILKSIARNKPPETDLPKPWPISTKERMGLPGKFMDLAKSAGSEIVEVGSEEQARQWIEKQKSTENPVIDLWQKTDRQAQEILSGTDLGNTDTAFVKGQFGVAENAAVWVDDGDMRVRALPFVVSHLVLVLGKKDILANMHEAYARIDLSNIGFGAFIAGPSKTADIEQALVIGAHGPLRNTILIF